MTIVKDSHQNVYDVPADLLERLAQTQAIVFDTKGREFGISKDDLEQYKLSEEAAAEHNELVMVKVLSGKGTHVQAPQKGRCCNIGDVVIWCHAWD